MLQPVSIKHTIFKNLIKLKSKLQKDVCGMISCIYNPKLLKNNTMCCLWGYSEVVKAPDLPKHYTLVGRAVREGRHRRVQEGTSTGFVTSCFRGKRKSNKKPQSKYGKRLMSIGESDVIWATVTLFFIIFHMFKAFHKLINCNKGKRLPYF